MTTHTHLIQLSTDLIRTLINALEDAIDDRDDRLEADGTGKDCTECQPGEEQWALDAGTVRSSYRQATPCERHVRCRRVATEYDNAQKQLGAMLEPLPTVVLTDGEAPSCPTCGNEVAEIDAAIRWNTGVYNAADATISWHMPDSSDWENDGYLCMNLGACGIRVQMPDEEILHNY